MDGRLYENLQRWAPSAFSCEGSFDVPRIAPVASGELPNVKRWKCVGELRGRDLRATDGVQMYVYDYKLEPLWNRPTAYTELLKKAGCVLSPDFSLYADVPKALGIYNHYRKHWLGAWWQLNGITVIPSICWAGADSFDWCFDGEPVGSVVSVSSVGTQRYEWDRRGFLYGYDAMLERLQPMAVLLFGVAPKQCRGNIVVCEPYYKQIERRACKDQPCEV